MRVLHVVWSFSPLTETFIYDLVGAAARRCETRVLAFVRENAETRPLDGVRTVPPPRSRLAALRDVALSWLPPAGIPGAEGVAFRRALLAEARAFAPDLIHAHFGEMGVLAAPVARRLGLPVVTSFYGYDASQRLREERWPQLFRALATGRNRTLALAEAMRRDLLGAGLDPDGVSVVYTGKRLADYPYRERSAAPGRLVSVGRLVEKKGHLDALDAVARLARDGAAIELDIVGDGPLAPVLRERVAALGLRDRVRLLGAVDHAATRACMEAADALLLCSRTAPNGDREGLPTVLLEAQALGLPCVATRHAGIPEGIPEPNHWLLAPEGDVAGIVRCLRALRDAPPARVAAVSRAGREHVAARHDVERQADRLVALYRDVAGG